MKYSKATKKEIGNAGEEAAAKDYIKEGYKLIKSNYNTRFGEIDLILLKQGEYVFSEVKTRNINNIASPAYSVDLAKQRKIISSAKKYSADNNIYDSPMRFDVVEIIYENEKIIKINRIENAF